MPSLLTEERLLFPLRHFRTGLDFGRLPRDVRIALGIFGFPRLVAELTGRDRASVDAFCREAERLGTELRARWSAPSGIQLDPFLWAASEALYVTIRALRPERMVETGVQRGVSTVFLLAGMERNGAGALTSIDLPTFDPVGRINRDGLPDRSFVAGPGSVGDLVEERLRARWTLRLGDARELLPRLLDELGTIDAFFHDSEHSFEQMTFEYEQAWRHLRPGGCLISDDVRWSEPAHRAWAEFVARQPGPAHLYFSSAGNRGMIRKR